MLPLRVLPASTCVLMIPAVHFIISDILCTNISEPLINCKCLLYSAHIPLDDCSAVPVLIAYKLSFQSANNMRLSTNRKRWMLLVTDSVCLEVPALEAYCTL